MRWFESHRQEWIAETLRVFGFINRGHIERKFGVSTPQASHDLKVFMKANPRAALYDASEKRYVADYGGLCLSGRDGECNWSGCPQNRDGEPMKTGRSCPREWPER